MKDKAREVVRTQYDTGDGTVIDLGLAPLKQVGTRVIVPYLSQEVVEAFRTGELHRWLQRCWWRAIQTRDVVINIIDADNTSQEITVPSWWQDEPWEAQSKANGKASSIEAWENIEIDSGDKIKRIALLYDQGLSDEDLDTDSPQFWGVQLLRGKQWIETLEFLDYIPKSKRPGFRGFVEFDRTLERKLRVTESSQHDRFDGRSPVVKSVRREIDRKVQEFAEKQGWAAPESSREAPRNEQNSIKEFFQFLAPSARRRGTRPNGKSSSTLLDLEPGIRWDCELRMDFPNSKTTRVNWGQSIENVETVVRLQSSQRVERATVTLEVSRFGDKSAPVMIASQGVEIPLNEAVATFGNYQVIIGSVGQQKIQCAEPGKWQLVPK